MLGLLCLKCEGECSFRTRVFSPVKACLRAYGGVTPSSYTPPTICTLSPSDCAAAPTTSVASTLLVQVVRNSMEPLDCVQGSDGRAVLAADPSIVCDDADTTYACAPSHSYFLTCLVVSTRLPVRRAFSPRSCTRCHCMLVYGFHVGTRFHTSRLGLRCRAASPSRTIRGLFSLFTPSTPFRSADWCCRYVWLRKWALVTLPAYGIGIPAMFICVLVYYRKEIIVDQSLRKQGLGYACTPAVTARISPLLSHLPVRCS